MGVVYLLGDFEKEGIYKIGVTKGKIEERIKKLQTGNGGEIYVIDWYETEFPFFIEKLMHCKYFSDRKKGEWFELSPEKVKEFKKDCMNFNETAISMLNNPFMKDKIK